MTAITLEPVSSRYGAPMGRQDSPSIETMLPAFVRLARVRLDSQGYDSGGAYWGNGAPLYVAQDDDGNRQFARGHSRAAVALALGIGALALKTAARDMADFQMYGDAVLNGRAPMPAGMSREYVTQWMIESGAAMGQTTARVRYPSGKLSRRLPEAMAMALVNERADGSRLVY